MKKCAKCGELKIISGYYLKQGKPFTECKECTKKRVRINTIKNKEKVAVYQREYRIKNLDKLSKKKKEYYQENAEVFKKYREKHYLENKDKYKEYGKKYSRNNREKENLRLKEFRAKNKHKYVEYCANRRALNKKAMPKWLTKEDLIKISDTYKLCKSITESTGITHNVDHRIPLKGKNVCGLHVPNNLQVISASDNFKKNNTYHV